MTTYIPDDIEREIYFKDLSGGYLSVRYDPYPENPFNYYDSLGTFYTWQNSYQSPSENPYRTAVDFTEAVLGEEKAAACNSMQDVLQALNAAGYAAAGIYRYEHGQVAYALGQANPYNDRWDSGAVGFAFVSPEKLAAEGMTKEQAIDCMEAEMQEYSSWANGDVFLVERYDEQGEQMDVATYYGIEGVVAEHPDVEPIDLGDFPDLQAYIADGALTNELEGEWFFLCRPEWRHAAYIKESMAIVSDEAGDSWRIVDMRNARVSFGEFETPQEALGAIKQHESLGKEGLRSFIPPWNLIERPLDRLKQQAKERASEKNLGSPSPSRDRKPPEMGL